MDVLAIGMVVVGLVLLVVGAEALVRGAARLAARMGIPPLIVGLTIVAAGTSSPELAAGLASAARGDADLAVGNVVGSNVFNVLFLLGLTAVLRPLVVAAPLVRIEVPVMIGASLALGAFALDGVVSAGEGLVFLAGLVAHLGFTVVRARRERQAPVDDASGGEGARVGVLGSLLWAAGGLLLLGLGARWLVDGAVTLAAAAGIPERVVGLTIVAIGTSLPEVATSVVATLRGERDIAVANAVGSNVFNLLCVLGASALVAPGGLAVGPAALGFDLPVMIAAAVACLPIFFTGWAVDRWEGWFFLGGYAAYLGALVLSALGNPAFESVGAALVWFVAPLSLVTLGVLAWRARRQPGPAVV